MGINFNGPAPKKIKYGGVPKLLTTYKPPPSKFLCIKCGKGGHNTHECKTRRENIKCPKCAGAHTRKQCHPSNRPKCANCGGPHTINYFNCTYLQKELKI